MTLHLTPYDLADHEDAIRDEGVSRIGARRIIAGLILDASARDRATAERLDALLNFEALGLGRLGEVAEKHDRDAFLAVLTLWPRAREALRRDPAKVAARKARRQARKAVRHGL